MSVKVQSLVWERAPYAAGSLLVLLALADWANDEGESWPAMETLAVKARMTKRNAQLVVRQMKKDGFLTARQGGGHKSNTYRINLQKLYSLSPAGHPEVKNFHPSTDTPNASDFTPETKSATSRGEKIGKAETKPTSSDPSLDPSLDPSVGNINAALRAAVVTDIGRMMKALNARIGPIPRPPAESAAAKWLLEAGYDIDTCIACLTFLSDEKWRASAVTWLTVKSQIGAWVRKNGHTSQTGRPDDAVNATRPSASRLRTGKVDADGDPA